VSLPVWIHTLTFHLTQVNTPCLNPSQTGWYSSYLPRRDERLSWPRWLVTYRHAISAHGWSPVQFLRVFYFRNFIQLAKIWCAQKLHVLQFIKIGLCLMISWSCCTTCIKHLYCAEHSVFFLCRHGFIPPLNECEREIFNFGKLWAPGQAPLDSDHAECCPELFEVRPDCWKWTSVNCSNMASCMSDAQQ